MKFQSKERFSYAKQCYVLFFVAISTANMKIAFSFFSKVILPTKYTMRSYVQESPPIICLQEANAQLFKVRCLNLHLKKDLNDKLSQACRELFGKFGLN